MIDFTKPLLPDEIPEPPIVEQKMKEEAQQRARASLAGIPGAARAAMDAGLIGKPAPPVARLREKKTALPKPRPREKAAAKAKIPDVPKKNPARNSPKPVKPEDVATPMPDRAWQLRQAALQHVLAGMPSRPDAEAITGLFGLFVDAPDKEAAAAALVITMTFLRSPAKARAPLSKALAPALRKYRGSRLASLLLQRLGHVVAAKPSASAAPPPGG